MPTPRLRSASVLAAVLTVVVTAAPATARTGHPVRSAAHGGGGGGGGGGTVTGLVTDTSGHPLTGVVVELVAPPTYVLTTADFGSETGVGVGSPTHNGRFRLQGVPSDAFIVCYATDFERVTGGTSKGGYFGRCTHRTVNPAPGATLRLPTVRLAPRPAHGAHGTATMVGSVVGFDGHRGPSVAVIAVIGAHRIDEYDVFTGDGRFRITGLPPGRTIACGSLFSAVTRTAPTGYVEQCHRIPRLVPGTTRHLTIRLPEGAAVSGRVTNLRGLALPEVAAVAVRHGQAHGEDQTDRHGQYRINGLPPGRIRVCFAPEPRTAPGAPTGSLPACHPTYLPIRLSPGQLRPGIDQQLDPAGAIAGRVARAGHAAGSAAVIVFSQEGGFAEVQPTRRDGRFHIAGLPPGRYQVCGFTSSSAGTQLNACTHRALRVRAARTLRDVVIALPRTGTIEATVTDPSGRALPGTDVAILGACHRGGGCGPAQPAFDPQRRVAVLASTTTGRSGRVRVPLLPPGHYAACAFAYYAAAPGDDLDSTGYADRCTSQRFDLTVRPGHTHAVRLRLAHAGAVTGVVTDRSGAPLPHARIEVAGSAAVDYAGGLPAGFGFGPSPRDDSYTDAKGRYTVYSVRPGARRVCVLVDATRSHACLAHPVTVTAGRVTSARTLHVGSQPAAAHVVAGPRSTMVIANPGHTALVGAALLRRFPQLRAFGIPAPARTWSRPGVARTDPHTFVCLVGPGLMCRRA